jgi:inhibitor of cysteine peptidase
MTAFKWVVILFMLFLNNMVFADKSNPTIYTEDKLNIMVTKDQPQFVIRLKANPTTGYSWFLREYNSSLITPLKHQYEAPNTKLIGAPGYEVWTFSIKPTGFTVPQVTQIHFVYARPWESDVNNQQLVFKISTE